MSQYAAKIILNIDPFNAKTHEEADLIVDQYVSLIAHAGGEITWCEVEWEIEEFNEHQEIL
jgi:hypothetical protein